MGKFYEVLPESQRKWLMEQRMFWVATAPLSRAGHVNVSPKGGPCFGLADERTFWYMDMTGSGAETIAHLHEPGNGRITIMFCAFDGPPRIIRLWGRGQVLEFGTDAFATFVDKNSVPTAPGTRSVVVVHVHQAGSSCGFSVPLYDFQEHRQVLNDHFRKKVERFEAGNEKESMDRYWACNNAWSVDKMPGMKRALAAAKIEKVEPNVKMVGPLAPDSYTTSIGTTGNLLFMFTLTAIGFILGVALGPHLIETLGNATESFGA